MSDPLAPYNWAKNEIGIAELHEPGQANSRILWYDSFTTLKATDDETPWCSAFMCAAAENNGYVSTKSAAAGSWLNFGDIGDGTPGDIAIFSRPGGHHVAFVNRSYTNGDRDINVLGGNQGGRVCAENFLACNLIALRRFPGV